MMEGKLRSINAQRGTSTTVLGNWASACFIGEVRFLLQTARAKVLTFWTSSILCWLRVTCAACAQIHIRNSIYIRNRTSSILRWLCVTCAACVQIHRRNSICIRNRTSSILCWLCVTYVACVQIHIRNMYMY